MYYIKLKTGIRRLKTNKGITTVYHHFFIKFGDNEFFSAKATTK